MLHGAGICTYKTVPFFLGYFVGDAITIWHKNHMASDPLTIPLAIHYIHQDRTYHTPFINAK
jgi:hypothetical protein